MRSQIITYEYTHLEHWITHGSIQTLGAYKNNVLTPWLDTQDSCNSTWRPLASIIFYQHHGNAGFWLPGFILFICCFAHNKYIRMPLADRNHNNVSRRTVSKCSFTPERTSVANRVMTLPASNLLNKWVSLWASFYLQKHGGYLSNHIITKSHPIVDNGLVGAASLSPLFS